MNIHEEEIRRRVRSVREAKGMSQTDLAGYMNARGFDFKQQTLNKIEKGQRRVSAAELVALASSLGVEASNLLGGGDSGVPLATVAGRLEEASNTLRGAAIAYGRAMLAYAQTVDGLTDPHANIVQFASDGLTRQTPGWVASGDVLGSLEATLKLNRVELTGHHALAVMEALRADHDKFHSNG
ncbi:helix-turn-helix domain-containing protein [Leucobacter sp. HY1910]